MNSPAPPEYAGLWPRLAATVYDSLPVLSLWFLVGMAAVALNGGQAVTSAPGRMALLAAMLASTLFYFAVSWRRAGQTLGMRAWRLRMVAADGGTLGGRRALWRAVWGLALALPCGLGLISVPFDRERRSLADLVCDTRVLRLPRGWKPPRA
jgi:uncharacterized RDD family membrane protein YckC